MPELLIRTARLFDGHRFLDDAAVLVRDEVIVAVGRWAELGGTQGDAETLDLGQSTLLPGLVDAHTHLVFSSEEDAMAQVVTDTDAVLLLRAVHNAEEALRAGITTVRDCGDRGNVSLRVRDAIATGLIRGPRVLACGMPITTTAGHCHFLGLEADDTEDLIRAVRRQVKAGVDWIKIMVTGGRLTPGSNPATLQYSAAQLSAAVADAHRLGRRVAAHVLGVDGIRAAVQAGVDTLEHVSWIKGGDFDRDYDEEVVAEIVQRGTWLSVTNAHSRSQHLAMLGEGTSLSTAERSGLDVYEVQLALIARMHSGGARMLVTDDAGCPRVEIRDFPLALASLGARTGIPPTDVLRMATSDAACAIGIDREVGTIEVGRRADLLAVHGDPGQRLADLTRTVSVWKGGHLVVADGKLI